MKIFLLITILVSLTYCFYPAKKIDIEVVPGMMCTGLLIAPITLSTFTVIKMKEEGISDKEIEEYYIYGKEAHEIYVDVISKLLGLEGASEIELLEEIEIRGQDPIDFSDPTVDLEDLEKIMGIIPRMDECVKFTESFLKNCSEDEKEFDFEDPAAIICIEELVESSKIKKLMKEGYNDIGKRREERKN